MDIKLTWMSRYGTGNRIFSRNRRFEIIADGIELEGVAYNHRINNSHYILRLIFQNKEVKKHPKYKEIRVKTIKLLIEATPHTLFSASVEI